MGGWRYIVLVMLTLPAQPGLMSRRNLPAFAATSPAIADGATTARRPKIACYRYAPQCWLLPAADHCCGNTLPRNLPAAVTDGDITPLYWTKRTPRWQFRLWTTTGFKAPWTTVSLMRLWAFYTLAYYYVSFAAVAGHFGAVHRGVALYTHGFAV
jgi:hypothetical protein